MIEFLYVIACLGWGWFTVVVQVQLNPITPDSVLLRGFVMNAIAMPFSIIMSAYRHWNGSFEVS